MPIYMQIKDGRVVGLSRSSEPIAQPQPGWEEISEELYGSISAQRLGGTLRGSVYTPPAPPPPTVTTQQFLMLFTRPQFLRLRELRDTDDDIIYYYSLMDAGSSIHLGHPLVQAAVNLLQVKDPVLFTPAEITRILAGQPPA